MNNGQVLVNFVSNTDQVANIITKPLTTKMFFLSDGNLEPPLLLKSMV